MNTEERRESFRLADVSKATCSLIDGNDRIQGTLKNLSRSGFFLETDRLPEVAKDYNIEIVLQGSHSRLAVDNLSGTVTRADSKGVAVEFSRSFEWLVLAPIFF
ncbi:MAG: PilZ domain-containing protein [Desulfofustis sp.]|nr:PilZ domain-containing protein [Desulfofustis sp.]MBT8346977.1 PilZ domain-containing protein [Desulfofustis sp.]MBT8354149.1 PilZ domain-containing protein [Desulfofustis sp.]NNF47754.1 PilZ domain-containing protein [Desulfofustis sp.]NNK14962.1 PilZ domain-containing protein [Desulfofustis sp.]